jgi:hypothetical protein
MGKDFGFIITRHVNSEKTNNYWNQCIICIRNFYPKKKIVVIDDNSNKLYLKPFNDYFNVQYIQSEYPGRGELLPYIYFLKYKFFENAVIIHDSVFFHKRINFEKLNMPIIPLWHFNADKENELNIKRIASRLKNSNSFKNTFDQIEIKNNLLFFRKNANWAGIFGVQSYINHSFLKNIDGKYNINSLLHAVKNRTDRCALERIMAVLFYNEYPQLIGIKSLFGTIHSYIKWGYSYDNYINDIRKYKRAIRPIIKVWTGR